MNYNMPDIQDMHRTIQNIQNLQMQSNLLMRQETIQHLNPPHLNPPHLDLMNQPNPNPSVPQNMYNAHQFQPNISQQPALKSIVLDSSIAVKLCMGAAMPHERSLMARNDIWHKIKIHRGAKYEKELVLKSILQASAPADLIPVKYHVLNEDAFFIARNCDKALDQLCKSSLIIKCVDETPLVLSVILGFASIHDLKINIQPLLLALLKKRCNAQKKTLILDEFHKDEDIYKTVYCPLSQNRTFSHILKLIKSALMPIEILSLKNNDLTQLTMFDIINIKSIKSLDLRNNNLLKIEVLQSLRHMEISEIWLDGNPLCDNYSNVTQYVESVRLYCPKLTKLDGQPISPPGFPLCFKIHIKNYSRRNLILQFVKHFFTAYDQRDRSLLEALYNENAMYSTTIGTPTNPKSKKSLQPFAHENRNLLIFGVSGQQLYQGPKQITEVLKRLPKSQHLHKSFCIDLLFDSTNEGEDVIAFSVEGLFKLVNVYQEQIYFFNRTFVIRSVEESEYKIVNDQYHVYLPVNSLENNVNHTDIIEENPPQFLPILLSPNEKDNYIAILQEASTMTTEYCEKFLVEANWDLKKAITNFITQYIHQNIPKEALVI